MGNARDLARFPSPPDRVSSRPAGAVSGDHWAAALLDSSNGAIAWRSKAMSPSLSG